MGARILNTLVQLTHHIDPTRPTVANMNHGWNDGGYSDMVDIIGYNYGQRGDQYLHDREAHPARKMICGESTSSTTTKATSP
jgi:beta-galactosidase